MTTPDTDTLRALLERVEGTTGPDRVLDGDLAEAFGFPPKNYKRYPGSSQWCHEEKYDENISALYWHARPATKSIDAALAFFEAVLPGYMWMKYPDRFVALFSCEDVYVEGSPPLANLPLAIVAATLKALITKAEGVKNGTV